MKRKTFNGNERVKKCMSEVAPLHVIESNMNTRKGMVQKNFNKHINERNAVLPIWHEALPDWQP